MTVAVLIEPYIMLTRVWKKSRLILRAKGVAKAGAEGELVRIFTRFFEWGGSIMLRQQEGRSMTCPKYGHATREPCLSLLTSCGLAVPPINPDSLVTELCDR